MGERGRALTVRAPCDALLRVVALAVLAVFLATIPGARVRAATLERSALELPPSPHHDVELAVRVVDADGGRPIAGAHVRVLALVDERAFQAGAGDTADDGQVALTHLPRGAAWIIAEAPGHARASTEEVLLAGAPPVELALGAPHRLDVSVADDLGDPVRGAVVEVSGGDPLPRGAATDLHGGCTLASLGDGPWSLVVHAPGFEEVVRRGVHEGETPRIVLRKLGALVVLVSRENGEPAPLARVQIAGATLWPARATDTAADGTVRISGLSAGSYALRATHGADVSPTELGVALARGEERRVTLRLQRGVFASARVVDGDTADAEPIAGARVTLIEGGVSPFPIEGLADEGGAVRLGPVAPGLSLLAAEAEGFVSHGPAPASPDGRAVALVLVRAGAVVGRVVDARGRPVGGVTIEIVGSDSSGGPIDDDPRKLRFRRAAFDLGLAGPRALVPSGDLGVVPGPVPPIPHGLPSLVRGQAPPAGSPDEPWVTRDDGTFRASPASPGRVRVIARHPEFLDGLSDVATLIPGGEVQLDVTLHDGGSLEGRVVDAAGRAVEGATVALAALRGSLERSTRSASDGTFAFAAVPEAVVVTASAGDDDTSRVARATVTVTDAERATVTLSLPDARPPLDVRVVDDRGFPVAAAQVSVASVDPAIPFRTTVFTDAHGEASVAGGRGVSLRLDVAAPGHAERAVAVDPSEPAATVTLEAAQRLRGMARESRGGAPVRGATVTLFHPLGTRHTVSDAAGEFTFPDVAAGAVRLRVQATGLVTKTLDVTVEDRTSGVCDLGALELDEEAVAEGTVVDARGAPVVGARVARDHAPTYIAGGSRDGAFAVTDAKGRFRLGGLEPGQVTIEAYAPDVGRARLAGVQVAAGRPTTGLRLRVDAPSGERASEPSSSGGVAVTLGDLAGDPTQVVVVGVADGSEAERVGLSPGDIILGVDGAAVHAIDDARQRLAGPVGEDVVVSRRRGEDTDSLRIPREPVHR